MTENNWQKLMNSARAKWIDNRGAKGSLGSCTKLEKIATLLGNLNYQTLNGGFVQWVDNGYGLYAKEVVEALDEVCGPGSERIKEMVEELIPHIDFNKPQTGWDDYWIYDSSSGYERDHEEEENSEGFGIAESFDSEFYALNEKWFKHVNTYFNMTEEEE